MRSLGKRVTWSVTITEDDDLQNLNCDQLETAFSSVFYAFWRDGSRFVVYNDDLEIKGTSFVVSESLKHFGPHGMDGLASTKDGSSCPLQTEASYIRRCAFSRSEPKHSTGFVRITGNTL